MYSYGQKKSASINLGVKAFVFQGFSGGWSVELTSKYIFIYYVDNLKERINWVDAKKKTY